MVARFCAASQVVTRPTPTLLAANAQARRSANGAPANRKGNLVSATSAVIVVTFDAAQMAQARARMLDCRL